MTAKRTFIVWLLIAGGVVYTVGGAIYARRWPNPAPRWFGFHEVFHACPIVAAILHATAIGIALF